MFHLNEEFMSNTEGNVENREAIRNVPQILCRNAIGIPTENVIVCKNYTCNFSRKRKI